MKRMGFAGAVLVVVLAATGCSGVAEGDLGGAVQQSEPRGPLGGGFDGTAGSAGAPDMARDEAGVDQQIIVTGQLSVAVERPLQAATEVATIVERNGGRVDGRRQQAPQGDRQESAWLTIRVPSDGLNETLDEIERLGELVDLELSESNVTSEVRDLEARITALQASVDRLLALLATATTTADLVSIETALSERQSELESLKAHQRWLGEQVALATVTVYLISEQDAPADDPNSFWAGLLVGWDTFVDFLGWLLIAIGVALPWLAVAGVLVLMIAWVLRRRRARQPADVS